MPSDFLSLFKNDNVSHSVHLSELFTVERCNQLPGPGLGWDEVFCQCHCGVTANITRIEMRQHIRLKSKIMEKGDRGEQQKMKSYPTITSWPF